MFGEGALTPVDKLATDATAAVLGVDEEVDQDYGGCERVC